MVPMRKKNTKCSYEQIQHVGHTTLRPKHTTIMAAMVAHGTYAKRMESLGVNDRVVNAK